jgi:hypothetical protein
MNIMSRQSNCTVTAESKLPPEDHNKFATSQYMNFTTLDGYNLSRGNSERGSHSWANIVGAQPIMHAAINRA